MPVWSSTGVKGSHFLRATCFRWSDQSLTQWAEWKAGTGSINSGRGCSRQQVESKRNPAASLAASEVCSWKMSEP